MYKFKHKYTHNSNFPISIILTSLLISSILYFWNHEHPPFSSYNLTLEFTSPLKTLSIYHTALSTKLETINTHSLFHMNASTPNLDFRLLSLCKISQSKFCFS